MQQQLQNMQQPNQQQIEQNLIQVKATPLMQAIIFHHLKFKELTDQELQKLVNTHKRKRDAEGKTALMYASECQYKQAVQLLYPHEQRLQDQNGKTAFMYACKTDNIEIMKILQSEKNILAASGETALMVAAAFNATNAMKELVQFQILKRTTQGNTALMIAAHMGNEEACKLLIKEAKLKNNLGMTALMLASYLNHVKVVELLAPLEGKMTSKDGYTALQYTAQTNAYNCTKLLKFESEINQTSDNATALMMAAEKNEIEIVKELMDLQAGKQRKDQFTALMLAISRNNMEIVDLLKEKEEHITNKLGFTPLMAAVNSKNIQMCEKFISYAGQQNIEGITALMYAADLGQLDIVKYLFEKEQGYVTKQNETVLHFAIRRNKTEIIDFLAETKENKQVKEQFTNNMYSAMCGCKYYIEKYGQKELKQCEKQSKQTALMTAAAYSNVDLFNVLESEIGMQDFNGNTSLMIFVQNCKDLEADKIKQGIKALEKEKEIVNNQGLNWKQAILSSDTVETLKQLSDEEIQEKCGQDQNILFSCIYFPCAKCFDYLLPKLAKQTQDDQTDILMKCSLYNRADLVQKILKNQNSKQLINGKNESGFTALMFAAQSGAIESAKLLTKQIGKQNNKGISALMIATNMANRQMMQFLIKEIKLVSKQMNICALQFAIRGKVLQNIDLLQQENNIEIEGETAAMIYIKQEGENAQENIIKQLLKGLNKKQIQNVINVCEQEKIKNIVKNYQ